MNVIYRGALPEDTEEMSRLIAAQNQQVERHVGYCGIHAAEIHHTLRQEFDKEKLERDFTLALFGNRMVGVLGFDLDPDTGLAEIWGPFIGWEDEDFQQKFAGEAGHRAALIEGLWAAALGRTEREPFRLQGFYHRDNMEAESLMLRSGASLTGQHLTLALRCEEVQGEVQGDVKRAESGIIELSPAWADPFVQLHDEAFRVRTRLEARCLMNGMPSIA